MAFVRLFVSVIVGFIIIYFGILLNSFITSSSSILAFIFIILAVFISNLIGKDTWNGLATFIVYLCIHYYFNKLFGEPEELYGMINFIVPEGIVALISTIIYVVIIKIKSGGGNQ